jgi:hypothetical protein
LERICNEVTVTNKGIIPAFAWKDWVKPWKPVHDSWYPYEDSNRQHIHYTFALHTECIKAKHKSFVLVHFLTRHTLIKNDQVKNKILYKEYCTDNFVYFKYFQWVLESYKLP